MFGYADCVCFLHSCGQLNLSGASYPVKLPIFAQVAGLEAVPSRSFRVARHGPLCGCSHMLAECFVLLLASIGCPKPSLRHVSWQSSGLLLTGNENQRNQLVQHGPSWLMFAAILAQVVHGRYWKVQMDSQGRGTNGIQRLCLNMFK